MHFWTQRTSVQRASIVLSKRLKKGPEAPFSLSGRFLSCLLLSSLTRLLYCPLSADIFRDCFLWNIFLRNIALALTVCLRPSSRPGLALNLCSLDNDFSQSYDSVSRRAGEIRMKQPHWRTCPRLARCQDQDPWAHQCGHHESQCHF